MRSLVEAVANVLLFILTPVALVWVQSRLAMAIETLGKLPMENERTVLDLSRSCLDPRVTCAGFVFRADCSQASMIPGPAEYWLIRQRHED
jgi:hypothetical protein